ncbi:BTAD domain-containing putative transcriptional regulator [Streptomyces sp. TS71-3]|uniref:AfsR/SARP family transcriptional regulator n=1 Tax=Streptomyces sp. TS71-3 TaxID=2733862 RepID=UPI001B21C041|nr:BTAD domain-containing putative transcriptional regulator [Streptomyces sp. TS71-3]GHJ41563.1 SARP family transcriptional regulator [Streptomyces sp. TS71-3]
MSLRFAVLGPLRAWHGEIELELGPPKQRSLLALLLIHAGHPVSVHEIVDTLWGQDPPDSAVNVVQRHVGALRRLLEPGLPARGASRWLVRGSGGYRLEVEPDSLDLLRFRALCQDAERSAEAGQPAGAAELLIAALDLWRGSTASGIAPEVRSHPAFTAVDREYADAVTAAADHALAAGPALGARVLAVLRQAAAQHPLDEALQARLVAVLAATGHQVEALDVYRTVGTRLAEDLGLEPGPELRAAQQQVLHQADTAPPAPPAEPESRESAPQGPPATTGAGQSAGVPVRPAQLPVSPATFTGRGHELDRLQELLDAADRPSPGVVIGLIGGMAGVGKTTLAVHWAQQVAHRFPGGQLYVDLRGFHPDGSIMSPSEAIRSFLDAFGVPSHRIPAGLEAQAMLYRTLLADRRMLVVLDNARDTEQVRPLLPGAPGSLVIVTSRNQLYGLVARQGARVLALNLLSEADAREFLTRRLGADRTGSEPGATAEIIARCGRLPLALAIVSARAAMSPAFTLASIAAELRDGRDNLDAFTAEAPLTDARSVFSWSYRALTPGAARLFRLLALHPGPDYCLPAAASLAGQDREHVRPLLSELVRAHLVTATAPDRYGCHDLLRAYATELLKSEETAAESEAARRRLLDHYLHSAHAADTALAPSRDRVEPPPHTSGVTVMKFDDQRGAAEWLEVNRPVLLAVIEDDARHGTGEHSWRLATVLEWYLDRVGRWDEQLEAQAVAVAAAERLGDRRGQAHAHRSLGFAHGRTERWAEAREHLSRSLELFGEIADPAGQGRGHRYLAYLANRRQRHEEALDHYERASALYRSAGRRSGVASIYNEVGWTYILMGEYDKALDECRRALGMHQEIADSAGEAAAWDSIGYAHHHLGEYAEALACFEHALAVYREISDRFNEADTLVHIGDTHHAANRNARAELAWRQALGILDEIGHPDAAQVRERLSRLREPAARAGRTGT